MIEVKRAYRHFKNKLYYVHYIAEHTETGEALVVYQALYGDGKFYVRPLSMFIEKVEEGRVDNITNQEYRFEVYKG